MRAGWLGVVGLATAFAIAGCDDGGAGVDPSGAEGDVGPGGTGAGGGGADAEPHAAGGSGGGPPATDAGGDPVCEATRPALASARVTVDSGRMLDVLGREVLLRGVNTGGRAKFPPFVPFAFAESGHPLQADAPPFDDALTVYADRLVDWGMNVARVPFTWEAVEPERGAFDPVYMDRLVAILQAFADRDIRSIVDFHQDVYARPYCGDGFPLWAVPEPVPDRPDDCTTWFTGYLSGVEVQAAFDRFWANEDGLQDAIEGMWRHVAESTWPIDAVIGFEIMNEPGWGTAEPADWQPNVLAPFYAHMAGVIRTAAPTAPVFFDSTGLDAVTARTFLVRPDAPDLVYAPHSYDGSVFLNPDAGWNGAADFERQMGRMAEKRDLWDVPVLVGEFGIQPSANRAFDYMRAHYDALDTHLLHATAWEYSTTVDDWNDEDMQLVAGDGSERETIPAIVRPYPAATSGRLTNFRYNPDDRTGEVAFEAEPGVSELRVPARVYPEGVDAWLLGVPGCVAEEAGWIIVRTQGSGEAIIRFGPRE